jgi:hypothetical protein
VKISAEHSKLIQAVRRLFRDGDGATSPGDAADPETLKEWARTLPNEVASGDVVKNCNIARSDSVERNERE